MKHILGLDLGTNSIGWALIKENNEGEINIIKTGVRIFPIGTIVDDKTGKEKTKNEQRREYRGASRMRYRFKLRRTKLKAILKIANMLPDFSKIYKLKGKKQSYELYETRAKAIDQQISLEEIGRIFLSMNKYRGFLSNAKKINLKEDEETGKVKKGIDQLMAFMQKNEARTIGEYYFKMHQKAKELYNQNKWHNYNEPIDERSINEQGEIILFNSNGIRRHYGRYTQRDM
jgi:CRISPR-associated endonuclease Csn1